MGSLKFLSNLLFTVKIFRFKCLCDVTKELKIDLTDLEEDHEGIYYKDVELKCERHDVFRAFLNIVKGSPEIMCHSANILHVLGSVTVICIWRI